jgi:hypothetical protein
MTGLRKFFMFLAFVGMMVGLLLISTAGSAPFCANDIDCLYEAQRNTTQAVIGVGVILTGGIVFIAGMLEGIYEESRKTRWATERMVELMSQRRMPPNPTTSTKTG